MSLVQLLFRNLVYFWRGNSAVLLGVVVGCAVLTGALLVGDSLQGSLRDQSLRRLGWIDHALVAPRFFRRALADEIAVTTKAKIAPAMLLQLTASSSDLSTRGITLLGVTPAFFDSQQSPTRFGSLGATEKPLVWVNRLVAEELKLAAGSSLQLLLQKPADVPRESALGKKDANIDSWDVEVGGILEDGLASRFSLRPQLETPKNIIVPLELLQDHLNLPGQVNALLAKGDGTAMTAALKEKITLEDWGLRLKTPTSRAQELMARYDRPLPPNNQPDGVLDPFEWRGLREKGKWLPKYAWVIDRELKPATAIRRIAEDFRTYFQTQLPYFALESKQLLLSDTVALAARETAKELQLRSQEMLVYLCRFEIEKIKSAGVVVAGEYPDLGDDGIALLDLGEPKFPLGTKVTLRYKSPESHGPSADLLASFSLRGYREAKGLFADPGITPDFPGITDKDDLGAWELPFDDREWQKNISAEYGDRFWREYRATPKAYVSLAQGEKLWGSRFGKRTSIQFFSTDEKIIEQFRSKLLAKLQPAAGGFVFEPVRAQALEASVGGTPFGLLFLGFSFFLILSALMLVGLLYRLNLDRRAQQTGVFFAEGFAAAVVRWLFLGEGLILAILGVLLGCGAAVLYSWALVQFLAAIWPGGALSSLLEPHWTLLSLSSGAVGALVVSVLTILWVVRAFGRVSPRALLAGQLDDSGTAHRPASWLSWVIVIGCVLLAVALLLIGPSLPGHEAKAGTFFGSGALFLTAGLTASLAWLKRPGKNLTQGNGFWSIARLGVGNAGRYPARSLLIVGLLASAAFMLVAVESFRRQAKAGDGSKNAADGGFALIAETDLPVIRDLNSEAGRAELLKKLPEGEQQPAKALLEQTTIIALRAKAGDDVSCLNLYKPRTPRVLGVPKSLIDRGGFVFDAAINRENPWQSLTQEAQQIPAFGESNTLIWMLKTGMGGIVEVPDGKGEPQPLKISGMMHDSVFQSSLLIAEERFLQLYPNHEGSNYFLIAAPKEHIEAVRDLLRKSLADRGVEIAKTKDKLASYLAVENTYLSTFQALGGLGLLLGSLGLAVVLLRAVWERRAELALFRALGYSRGQLVWLVLVENGFLLLLGLSLGTIAALLSILPQLFSGAGAVPVMNLLMLYGGVIVVGLVTGLLAITGALQTPIVPALRRE